MDKLNITSEQELQKLLEEGKITEKEYEDLLDAMNKSSEEDDDSESVYKPKAKISKTAVAGAITGILPALIYFMGGLFSSDKSSNKLLLIIQYTLASIFLAGPFVTTILGIISLKKIRKSSGRLYGIVLALAVTIFYPAFLIWVLSFGFVSLIRRVLYWMRVYNTYQSYLSHNTVPLLIWTLWLVTLFLTIRWLWKRYKRPVQIKLV